MFQPHFITTVKHTLYVETLGDSRNPPCLLIPGAMQGTWGWSDNFCQRIANATFYVLRFDHRDIGRSTATPTGETYTLADLGQDIIAILDAFHIDKAHLAGHSMGGHLCQRVAVDYPERVLTICPIGSGPIGPTAATEQPLTQEEQATLKRTWEIFLGRKDSDDLEEQIEGYLEVYRYLSGTRSMDEEMGRAYVVKMIDTCPAEYLQAGNLHEKVMEQLATTLSKQKGILQKIRAPTLIVHGDLDPIALPRMAISMTDEIPNAQLKLIPSMGHMFLNRELEETIADALIHHMKSIAR